MESSAAPILAFARFNFLISACPLRAGGEQLYSNGADVFDDITYKRIGMSQDISLKKGIKNNVYSKTCEQ